MLTSQEICWCVWVCVFSVLHVHAASVSDRYPRLQWGGSFCGQSSEPELDDSAKKWRRREPNSDQLWWGLLMVTRTLIKCKWLFYVTFNIKISIYTYVRNIYVITLSQKCLTTFKLGEIDHFNQVTNMSPLVCYNGVTFLCCCMSEDGIFGFWYCFSSLKKKYTSQILWVLTIYLNWEKEFGHW